MILTPYRNNIFSGRVSGFNPLNINGLQLYLNQDNATASSWVDQSPNAFNFEQGTGTQQPVISANSVDYDGVDDIQTEVVANPFSGDSSGIMFFSGYNTGNTERYLASSDNAGAMDWIGFSVSGNKIGFFTIIGGSSNFVQSDVVLPLGYFYGYIKSTGTSTIVSTNGAIDSPTGVLDGTWFGDVPNRDSLELGGVLRNSPLYGDAQINKIIYSNAALTSGEIDEINTFMSNPSN
jgi:hypothetical protein